MTCSNRLRAMLLGATLLTPSLAAAAPPSDPTPAELRAAVDALAVQVKALQAQLDGMKAAVVKETPSWKGAPQFDDKDAGFSFKPRGLLQADAGYVGFPNGRELSGTVGGLDYNRLGFNTRLRRATLGAEGSLPGGFGYNVEFNFAQGTVDFEDIFLAYQAKGSPVRIQLGNIYPLSSLETITSSRFTSFLERASFTDGFGYNRRLGVTVALLDPKSDRYTLTGGLFSQPVNDNSFTRTGWEVGARGTFSPKLGDTTLHLGASAHHRVNNRDAQGQQYRSRPLVQTTDQRLVDTGMVASDGDDAAGLEFGAIHHGLHLAAEAQMLWVRGYRPGDVTTHPNNLILGKRYAGNPSFTGGYVEAGYYFTGEMRGYRAGRWDRTKVLHPLGKGGWGALQLNGRIDYLDLSDRVSGATLAAPDYVDGGRQIGYQLSLAWNPTDYVRFVAQYGRLRVNGGPRVVAGTPGLFSPGTTVPVDQRAFDVDTGALRAQLDF